MNFSTPVLAPSILAADFSKLGEEIKSCTDAGIQWLHCDIMDGHFVPNISYGPMIVEAARKSAPDTFIDTHLMIENPDQYIEAFADAGSDLISVHYEACPHLHRTIQNIQNHGCMTGVVINPATAIEQILPIMPDVDLVLLMSVNPGFGGQKFINRTFEKLKALNFIKEQHGYNFLIQIDGGVGLNNIQQLVQDGADILVAGSSVFKADDIENRINQLMEKANKGSTKSV